MSALITAIIGTRNEAHKLRTALTHCLRWADEVVVVDKDSTDGTPDLVREMGGRYVNAGFTRQGHESVEEQVSHATHDWVWIWTSHEVPTPACIAEGRKYAASGSFDIIAVPMYYYSFGIHHDDSPWSGGYQPRLFNRRRVTFTGLAHDPIRPMGHIGHIPKAANCHVLHQTHSPVERFMLSHLDYMVNEAAHGDPAEVFNRALKTAEAFDTVFRSDPALVGQALGWRHYWYGVALHAWERLHPGIPEQYAARCEEALKQWNFNTEPTEIPE